MVYIFVLNVENLACWRCAQNIVEMYLLHNCVQIPLFPIIKIGSFRYKLQQRKNVCVRNDKLIVKSYVFALFGPDKNMAGRDQLRTMSF